MDVCVYTREIFYAPRSNRRMLMASDVSLAREKGAQCSNYTRARRCRRALDWLFGLIFVEFFFNKSTSAQTQEPNRSGELKPHWLFIYVRDFYTLYRYVYARKICWVFVCQRKGGYVQWNKGRVKKMSSDFFFSILYLLSLSPFKMINTSI